VFAPVCGVDGVSYSNDCEANKVGVTIAYSGECEVPAEKCSPGSSCATEGSSCSMGTETCCGQTYDSLKCNCSDGIWMCHIAEACMLPCAPTFSPTKRTRQPTPLPSQNPTRTPTSQPAAATTTTTTTVAATTTTTTEGMVTHSSGLCGKWHVSREAPGTCTNSGVGTQEPTSSCIGWFQTGEECCMAYVDQEDCPKVDVTVSTTKATTTAATTQSCGSWHVSREAAMSCTNSKVGMKEPTPPGCVGWYDSGEECCSSYLGRECPMIDVSGDTTSTEATMPVSSCDEWHIVPTNKYVCTNSEDYPPVWKEHYYEIFFFETADACCGTVEGGCKEVVNVCASCTEEYSPVCGSDASTYDNSCKAEAAGIKEYVSGTCEQVAEATTTTTTTTPATTTTTTSKTTTTTTTPATTTTTTPATTTSTTTTSSTTPLTTTTSTTTTTTTTSDPGDMQQNSGSGSTTTPYRCSDHKRRRPCSRAEKYGCNWDRSERVCRHNDEIVANSGSGEDPCSSFYRRKSQCLQAECTWKRSKARKERCKSPSPPPPP